MELEQQEFQGASPETRSITKNITRRKFLQIAGGMVLSAAVAGGGGLMYMTKVEPGWVDIVPVNLTLPRLDPAFNGFRLCQISDIHISHAVNGEMVAEACRSVIALKPDLVVFTGDYIDEREHRAQYTGELMDAVRPLVSSISAMAILGNHDYYIGSTLIHKMLRDLHIQGLNNQVVSLSRGKARLHIAGLDDIWNGIPRMREVLSALPADGAAVLLAHEPDYADSSAKTGRFDLQLSGHSHGGQVVLPLLGPPMLPEWGRKYPAGLYRVGNMYQYTNRGLGMTMPYMRLNCRPEITIFQLQSAQV